MAFLRGDALGVELHAVDRQGPVLQAHDDPILGGCGDLQVVVRKARRVDGQRMVARGGQRRGQAGEDAAALVAHMAQPVVQRLRGASVTPDVYYGMSSCRDRVGLYMYTPVGAVYEKKQ